MAIKRTAIAGFLLLGSMIAGTNAWNINLQAPPPPDIFRQSTYPMYINNNITGNKLFSAANGLKSWFYGTGTRNGPIYPNNFYTSVLPQYSIDGVSVIGLVPLDDIRKNIFRTIVSSDGESYKVSEADIFMNSNVLWSEDLPDFKPANPQKHLQMNYYSFLAATMHEIGHTYGINHSSEIFYEFRPTLKNATMFYWAFDSKMCAKMASLNEYDIKAARMATNGTPFSNWQVAPENAAQYYYQGITYTLSPSQKTYAEGGSDQGVTFSLTTKGTGAWWEMFSIQNLALNNIFLDDESIIEWEQFDKSYALWIQLRIYDENNNSYSLFYSLNATEWNVYQGWVDMASDASKKGPNKWETISRNILNDFAAEYGTAIKPVQIASFSVGHFVYTGWAFDQGGTVRGIFIK